MHVPEVQSTIMIVLSPTYHARMGDCQVLNTESLLNQANILLKFLGQTLANKHDCLLSAVQYMYISCLASTFTGLQKRVCAADVT